MPQQLRPVRRTLSQAGVRLETRLCPQAIASSWEAPLGALNKANLTMLLPPLKT